jgi:hypothetical protein
VVGTPSFSNTYYFLIKNKLNNNKYLTIEEVLGSPHDSHPKSSSSAQPHSQPMLLPIADCSLISHPFQMLFSISFLIFFKALVRKKVFYFVGAHLLEA